MKAFSLFWIILFLFSCSTQEKRDSDSAKELAARGCIKTEAKKLYEQGFELQKKLQSAQAIELYSQCLKVEPHCQSCLYELGWSYWAQSQWKEVVSTWKNLYQISPDYPGLKTYLDQAVEKYDISMGKKSSRVQQNVEIGIRSHPDNNQIELRLTHRFQQYNRKPSHPKDRFDTDIFSPKSIQFSENGSLAYVNSLEGYRTVIYDTKNFKKLGTISHRFTKQESHLFQESAPFSYFYRTPLPEKNPNVFSGKPVESTLSHDGKYLWIPYYRRDFDKKGTSPSAVSIIDTNTKKIVRVMATGPISKYVKASPDHKWVAISHWGDNTIDLISTEGKTPRSFYHAYHLSVEEPMDLDQNLGDRDKECGFCLRGMAFSRDSRYLFVARMSGGGIAVFEIPKKGTPRYLTSIFGFRPTPRDIHVSKDGQWLYVSSNISGYVSKVKTQKMIQTAKNAKKPRTVIRKDPETFVESFVGPGARSIRVSPSGKYLFAAINLESQLAVLLEKDLSVIEKVPVDAYPVGLDVHPRGSSIWVTSQGRNLRGGNSVSIYSFRHVKGNASQ